MLEHFALAIHRAPRNWRALSTPPVAGDHAVSIEPASRHYFGVLLLLRPDRGIERDQRPSAHPPSLRPREIGPSPLGQPVRRCPRQYHRRSRVAKHLGSPARG